MKPCSPPMAGPPRSQIKNSWNDCSDLTTNAPPASVLKHRFICQFDDSTHCEVRSVYGTDSHSKFQSRESCSPKCTRAHVRSGPPPSKYGYRVQKPPTRARVWAILSLPKLPTSRTHVRNTRGAPGSARVRCGSRLGTHPSNSSGRDPLGG